MNIENKEIVVCGIARNAKMGAIVDSEKDGAYYIENLHSWGDLTNKKVCVTGIPDSVIVQPVPMKRRGMQQGFDNTFPVTLHFIKNAKWNIESEGGTRQ